MRRANRRSRAAVLAAFVVVVAAACSIHDRARTAAQATSTTERSVCVIFVDGLSQEALDALVSAGALPAIKREILDRGLVFETAVASVPSETYPNTAAMLTGLFPGHHGIPANVWLDRRLRLREAHTNIFRTYSASDFIDPSARTLYERLPANTVAVTAPLARGVTVHVTNLVALFTSYLRNDWAFLDRKTLDDVGDAYAGAASGGGLPSLVWGHLLGPDEVAHADGADSAAFRATLVTIDRAFDRLVRRLTRRKIRDRVLFVLVGDHGNARYSRYVDAAELVHRALLAHPASLDCSSGDCRLVATKKGQVDVGDAEIAVGAYRGAMIWLPSTRLPEDVPKAFGTRKRKGRRSQPRRAAVARLDFAEALAHDPELALVLTRGPEAGTVLVYSDVGHAEIQRQDFEDRPSRYSYRVTEGRDPLGYPPDLLGPILPAEEWLARTALTEYPDLVVQLSEFFDATRAPDVYISPKDGYGFREGKAGGHGALSRREMVVPLVFAGPGVRPGRRPVARTVDLAPTLLRYLGVPFDPESMDGDDLRIAPAVPRFGPVPRDPEGE